LTEEILVLKQENKDDEKPLLSPQKSVAETTTIDRASRSAGEEVKNVKVVIGIPACSSRILLERTVRHFWGIVDDIFVCDDGTTNIASMKTRYMGCKVVSHPPDLGYFTSVRFLMSAALNAGADVFVVVDAGTMCTKKDIENLAKPVVFEGCDVVLGVNEEQDEDARQNEYFHEGEKSNSNREEGEEQYERPRLKAYGKSAMLQLIHGEREQSDPEARIGRMYGLKFRKCPLTIYGSIHEKEEKNGKQSPYKIKPLRRGTRTVRMRVAFGKNLRSSLFSFFEKVPNAIKSIHFPHRFASANRIDRKKEQLGKNKLEAARVLRRAKLIRSIRSSLKRVKRFMGRAVKYHNVSKN
jgi:hypothetical protein